MAKKWAEVASSAQYQALSPTDKEAAREQYFDQVIKPQVPGADLQTAKTQFDADTVPKTAAVEEPAPDDGMKGLTALNPTLPYMEGMMKAASGMALAAPSGIAGLLSGAWNRIVDRLGAKENGNAILPKFEDPAKIVGDVQSLAYEPRTAVGGTVADVLNYPGAKLDQAASAAGDKTMDATGSPVLATTAKTAIDALPMLLDPALRTAKGMLPKSAPEPLPKQGPVTRDMTPDESYGKNVETLLANDIPLSTAQRGKDFANKQAASAQRAADTILGPSKLLDQQGSKFTSAVLKFLRLDADRASTDVMSELKRRTSQTYDDLTSRVPTLADKTLVQQLSDAKTQILTKESEAAPIATTIDSIMADIQAGTNGKGPFLPGEAAQSTRAALGRSQLSQNSSIAHWAGEVKEILDDAFERSASPQDAAAMRQVRADVQKTKQIEPAIGPDGIISPAKLYQQLTTKSNRGQRVYGGGDQSLVELAKAAKDVLPERLGNSGTTQRGMDVGKILSIVKHPMRAAVEGTALATGRLTERNAGRGTLSAVTAKNAALQQPAPPAQLTARGVIPTAETPEQRRKRQMAEALAGVQ